MIFNQHGEASGGGGGGGGTYVVALSMTTYVFDWSSKTWAGMPLNVPFQEGDRVLVYDDGSGVPRCDESDVTITQVTGLKLGSRNVYEFDMPAHAVTMKK